MSIFYLSLSFFSLLLIRCAFAYTRARASSFCHYLYFAAPVLFFFVITRARLSFAQANAL